MNIIWTRMLAGAATAAALCIPGLPKATAALLELKVEGTIDGAWAGFPAAYATQTAVYDTGAVPIAQVIANVATASYPLVSYELTFGATTMTPIADWAGAYPSPRINITDTTAGGPFGNPDAFQCGARLNESFAGWTMNGFLFHSFDYSFNAISDTSIPTSLAYFDQFSNSRIVQIDAQSPTGGNYAFGLTGQAVTLTEVPEPGALTLLSVGLIALRRRR